MVAEIKLKRLTGIQVGKDLISESNSSDFETKVNSADKLAFAGHDYRGTLNKSGNGMLELYLEGPETHFKIEGIKTSAGGHTLSSDAKDAVIKIDVQDPKITEIDSGWLTTQLHLTKFIADNSSLKFGEWNNYDLPDRCYVDISFA